METSGLVEVGADTSWFDLKEFELAPSKKTSYTRKDGARLGPKLLLSAVGVLLVTLVAAASSPRAMAHLKVLLGVEGLEGKPVSPVKPYVELGLPTMEQAEARMPQSAKEGKMYLEAIAAEGEKPDTSNLFLKLQLTALAKALTSGEVGDIMGLRISLANITSIHDPDAESDATLVVKVTGVLSHTYRDVVLQVVDEASGSTKALRVLVDSSIPSASGYTTVDKRINEEFQLEMRNTKQACADVAPNRAARNKGIAVPLYVATMTGIRPVTRVDGMCIFYKVQLMEPFQINLQLLWEKHKKEERHFLPGAKEYIARRLLLATLFLQETQVVYNDFNFENILVRKDGSVLISNFTSGVLFGEKRKLALRLSGQVVEPQIALEYLAAKRSDAHVTGQPQVNMWSLGAILYELFTNGQSPYNYRENNCLYVQSGDRDLLENLIKDNPSEGVVRRALEEADVPLNWQNLICRLTRVNRNERITAEQIVQGFPELIGL